LFRPAQIIGVGIAIGVVIEHLKTASVNECDSDADSDPDLGCPPASCQLL